MSKLLKKPLVGTLLSIVAGLMVGAIVLGLAGYNSLEAYRILLFSNFERPRYMVQVLINAAPIIMTGLSVSFAGKTGLFNIGAEGQFIMGSITAAVVGHFIALPALIHPLVILVLAFVVGGAYAALAAWLKNQFNIHEVISTIMLNWIAFNFNNYVVSIPAVRYESSLRSKDILESARLLIAGSWKTSDAGVAFLGDHKLLREIMRTDVHWGIFIALCAAFALWYLLWRTKSGYKMRAVGLNPSAAEFAGIDSKRTGLKSMFIAGGLAALGGAFVVMSSGLAISTLSAQEGYGWDGITVALIAGYSPIGCILSGLFYAGLKYGGGALQQEIGAPNEIINIMIGVIVYFIALSVVLPVLAEKVTKSKGETK